MAIHGYTELITEEEVRESRAEHFKDGSTGAIAVRSVRPAYVETQIVVVSVTLVGRVRVGFVNCRFDAKSKYGAVSGVIK